MNSFNLGRMILILVLWIPQRSNCLAQETAGIGVALSQKDDRVIIGKLLPDGAASSSGQLHTGDWIIGVQEADEPERDVSKSDIQTVVSLIRGMNGTVIRLTVVPEGKKLTDAITVTMKRGAIAVLERFGDGKLPKTGGPFPQINLTPLEDSSKEITTLDLRGRYVYVEIWATWCGTCQKKMDQLQESAKKYDSLNEKLAFISASVDDSKDIAVKHIEMKKWHKTVNMWLSETETKELHVNALPTAFLIDDKGTIIANSHEPNFDDEVSKLLKRLSGD